LNESYILSLTLFMPCLQLEEAPLLHQLVMMLSQHQERMVGDIYIIHDIAMLISVNIMQAHPAASDLAYPMLTRMAHQQASQRVP
jgi:hypothetical protein